MNNELSPKTKEIAAAADKYAERRAVDRLDAQRLRLAFIEGAACGVDMMRGIYQEVTSAKRD